MVMAPGVFAPSSSHLAEFGVSTMGRSGELLPRQSLGPWGPQGTVYFLCLSVEGCSMRGPGIISIILMLHGNLQFVEPFMYINVLIGSHTSPVRTKHILPSPRPYHLDSPPLDSNPFPAYTGYQAQFLASQGHTHQNDLQASPFSLCAPNLLSLACPIGGFTVYPGTQVRNPEAHWPCLSAYRQPQSCPLSEPMTPLLSKPTAPC